MAKRKKAAAAGSRVTHPRSCACKGFGVIPASQVVEKGVVYTKVSMRCPGTPVQTSAPSAAPAPIDGQQLAAGEGRS
jgi:hypothetical protein